MNRTLLTSVVVAATALSSAREVTASPDVEARVSLGQTSLRQQFGADVARRLLRGADSAAPGQDVLRGIERAASLGSPEGPALLVQVLSDPRGPARTDARVLLAVTRALAPFVRERGVARALAEFVVAVPVTHGRAGRADDEGADLDRRARLEIARRTAAVALAEAGDERAVELLVSAARGTGPGQLAAIAALEAFPPVVIPDTLALTPGSIALAGALGDLRAADAILEAAASIDPAVRAASLQALGAMGDGRLVLLAIAAEHDADASVRRASAEALVRIGAPDAVHAVRRLLEDDATAVRGVELSEAVPGDEVTAGLVSRIHAGGDRALRSAAVVELGRRADPKALAALAELLADPALTGDAADAIARSPLPAAWDVIGKHLAEPPMRRLSARMAAVRGRLGPMPVGIVKMLHALADSADGADRAAAKIALLVAGEATLRTTLDDPDPRVRRAAAMASDPTEPLAAAEMLRHRDREHDALTRLVLTAGLASGDRDALVSTTELLARLREGDVDAPVSALALASRGDLPEREAIDAALTSSDVLLRAHAAEGLAVCPDPTASGRLAAAYEAETDLAVRRRIIVALAQRTVDRGVPFRDQALDRAARNDPDPSLRAVAWRGLLGYGAPERLRADDVIWIRAMTAEGKPVGGPPLSGVVVRADGVAVPVVFDEDGYVLIVSPRGPTRLMLAPRLAAYEASPHADGP